MLFSHPGNADHSFPENFTPSLQDSFFGASFNGFGAFSDLSRDLLAFANPEFEQADMTALFRRIGARMRATRRPFRCVVVIPYDKGKQNRSDPNLGIALACPPGCVFTPLFVIKPYCFHFWDANFWAEPRGANPIGNGAADFTVGILMFENSLAQVHHPVDWAALVDVHHYILGKAGIGNVDSCEQIRKLLLNHEICLALLNSRILDLVQSRLLLRCQLETVWACRVPIAGELGLVDKLTQSQIGAQLGGLRASYGVFLRGCHSSLKRRRSGLLHVFLNTDVIPLDVVSNCDLRESGGQMGLETG